MPALIVLQVISSSFGFSRKRRMLLCGVGLDQAVGGRIVDRRQHDGRARAAAAMKIDEAAQIDLRQHVAVEHDERIAHPLRGVADGARRAERCRLDDVPKLDAGVASVAEHLFDAVRLIVEAENHLVDLRHLLDEIELIVEKRPVEDRNDRLRCVNGEGTEPRALAPDEKKRFHIEA